MSARPSSRSPIRRMLVPILVAAYLGYFGFHAISGTYGLRALAELEAEEVLLQQQLAELREEKSELEDRAQLIRPDRLDPDMVDELARRSLNVIAPNEVVLLP